MKTDSGGRDYKSKYTEKSITGRKADREYKAQPYIAAGISDVYKRQPLRQWRLRFRSELLRLHLKKQRSF